MSPVGLPALARAVTVAGTFSGMPSTAWALARRDDPLEATWAAGQLVLPGAQPGLRLLVAAGVAHGGLTVGWTAALARWLPRRTRSRGGRIAAGAVAGLAIAVLDLGFAHAFAGSPRLGPIARLRVGPQVADHIAFGALAGAALGP